MRLTNIIDIFNKLLIIRNMKQTLLLLMLVLSIYAHIYSSPPKVNYDYNGNPKYYSLFLSLETGIGASDYIKLLWPEQIYITLKTEIVVNLISFSNNLQVASANCAADGIGTVTIYHVTFGYAIQPNTWYQLQVYPTKNPVAVPISYLVQVLAVSHYNTNFITYDSNLAFGFIDILALPTTVNNLVVVANSSSTQSTVPSSIYSLDIYITPTITSTTGGNFTLSIYYDSADGTHATGTTLNDFTFMGLCQSAATASLSAAVLLFCSISSDLSTITFALSSVTATQSIRISTSINNPAYYSVRGIKGYWTEFISGRVMQNGKHNIALSVNKINILTISPRVLLFWGIEPTYTDSTLTTSIPLFKAGSAGTPNILPYNSFNVGFSFSATSPIAGQYIVQMTLGATGVVQGSIAHNLPSYNGQAVYCFYSTTYIQCNNVGAFINTGYRYFISGKAYFNNAVVSPVIFGGVTINPVVYTNAGTLITTPILYVSLAGQSIVLQPSQQFLDTSGYHNINSYSIGNAQVVSFYDDQSLSSTANAIQGFLQGTNSSVGVIPDLGTSQQLLFLLKTPTASIFSGGNAATDFTIQVMFNSQVISFQTAGTGRGLDFVGYLNGSGTWSIQGSPCYYTPIVCQKYNNDTPIFNTKSLINTGSTINLYGMYNFQCGSTYTTPTGCISSKCETECNMFTGMSNTDKGSSVMAMRQVVLPNGYHSPIYADKNLLDFLLIFKQGSQIISYCLINAYTVTGARMQNIKAAYVNYYDNAVSPYAYNKGIRIPMMVRIGGGVLPAQSKNATAIGIFFDDYIDASTFYTTTGSSWAVGCSTNNCAYYPNKGLGNVRMDNWHTNRMVLVYNLPPIQNQFNILVPVTPDMTNRNPPKILTIAFFTQNYTVGDTTGLLQTQSVYRLFGPVVTGSITGAITSINGLIRNNSYSWSTPDVQMSANNFVMAGGFGVSLNTTNMYSNPINNTFTYTNSDDCVSFGSYFGAGYTITSFFYNIFASSTLQWATPPSNTATTCTIFGYVYNQIQSPGANLHRTNQWIYTAYCPIDSTFNVNNPVSNIDFLNPQYPSVFTNGYLLRTMMAIAYSNQNGFLRAYRLQTNGIGSLVRSCTTAKLQTYNPQSNGKQRSTFTLTTPAITMSSTGYSGFSTFRVNFAIPSTTVTSSGISFTNTCQVSLSTLTCTVVGNSPTSMTVRIGLSGTGIITVTYLQINLYATVSNTFGSAANYIVSVILPQYSSSLSNYVPFGDINYGYTFTYCTCQSSFTVGITAYGTNMNFNNLLFSSNMINTRSKISFNFGASSYRETFFSTSYLAFDFGFLSTPAATYYSRSNFRCLVYEGLNATSLTLSSSWSTISLSSLNTVYLYPKAEISNPSSILYTMICYGSGVPNGGSATSMTLNWIDSGTVGSPIQTAIPIVSTVATLNSTALVGATLSIDYKRFRTAGFKSLYSFKVNCVTALTANARFYFDFHMNLNSKLDNEGVVQCYIRTASAIVDSTAQYTYCTFVNPWQLMVWNLNNVASNAYVYIDVFNIDQPLNGNIGGNQKIGLTIDGDGTYSNGNIAYVQVTDLTPPVSAAADIIILSSLIDNNFILSTQTLTMTMDTLVTSIFSTTNYLYVLFPASYSQWISRAQSLQITYPTASNQIYCELNVTNTLTNLATACVFISQRMLKITVSIVTNRYFSLKLMNIQTPAAVPNGKYNQYKFKLFAADSSQLAMTYYSFTDYSQHLTLTTNPSLISLSWNYYSLSVSDSLFTLTPITNQVITVQMGYYSNVIELRQSIFPANFKATLVLTINTNPTYFISIDSSLTVNLGKPISYFRLAATAAALPGLYTLLFTKSGDTDSVYTNIPPLTLVIQSGTCTLTTDASTYTVPLGGSSLPIVINGINCLPIDYINVTASFSSGEFSINADRSTQKLSSATVDGKMYFIAQHTLGSLVAGNSVTVTFTVSGPSNTSYAVIAPVTLTLVDPTTFQTYPTATALSAPVLSANTASFQLQCSQSSLIFWGIGIYPSILNKQAVDFEARIISNGNGLATNFTEPNDYYGKVYGIKQGSTMQVIAKKLYNLQSNTNYLFKYFCVNQLGHVSDSQSINFTTLNYGAYLMKVQITFRGSITYQQYNDLACSLAKNFIIPYSRVITEAMSYCGNTPYIFYAAGNNTILNQPDSNGWYIYGFYIEPDFTIASDLTNANIRNQLSINTQATTIITSTANYISLPSLVQMQTSDIQIYTVPIMSVSTPLSGLTSVVISASITNMNGFIVIGVLSGLFDPLAMTVPSTTNIKQGLFSSNVSLISVQMIHSTQNYNTSFQFAGLTANTLYTFFYFCSVEDPSITSLSSSVGVVNAQTLQMLVIDINWASYLSLAIVMLMVLWL